MSIVIFEEVFWGYRLVDFYFWYYYYRDGVCRERGGGVF